MADDGTTGPWESSRCGLGVHRVLLTLLALAAIGQWVLAARLTTHVAGELASTRTLLASGAPDLAATDLAAEAHRVLPALAASLPLDARVMLVSGHPLPVQFEFYFLPRAFRMLQPVDDQLFQDAAARWPTLRAPILEAQRQLERQGVGRTPERLSAALAWADQVVTFLVVDDLEVLSALPEQRHATLASDQGAARLYEVINSAGPR